jgi:hypothetical protein
VEKHRLGFLSVSAIAVVLTALAFGDVSAEEKKKKGEPKPPTCNSLKEEAGCTAREDCTWVAASIDAKTQKEKRKAYCRSKPKPKPKPKPKTETPKT